MPIACRAMLILGCCLLLSTPARPDGAGQARGGSQAPKSSARGLDSYQVAAGAPLSLKLRTALDSASTRVDDQVEATLEAAVRQSGVELIPAGSMVIGKVIDVVKASPRSPRGSVAFTFAVIQHAVTDSRAMIATRAVAREAEDETGPDGRTRPPSRKRPVDAVFNPGEPLVTMLTQPLIVHIPR